VRGEDVEAATSANAEFATTPSSDSPEGLDPLALASTQPAAPAGPALPSAAADESPRAFTGERILPKLDAGKPGRHTVVCVLNLRVPNWGDHRFVLSETFETVANVEEPTGVANPALREDIRVSVLTSAWAASRRLGNLQVNILSLDMPTDVAFDVYREGPEADRTYIGSFVGPKDRYVASTLSTKIAGGIPDHIKLVLRPNPRLALKTATIDKVWIGEDIRIECPVSFSDGSDGVLGPAKGEDGAGNR
jgi:hypothetical protein